MVPHPQRVCWSLADLLLVVTLTRSGEVGGRGLEGIPRASWVLDILMNGPSQSTFSHVLHVSHLTFV